MTPQKERLLRAKIALALLDTLKRRPTEVEIEKYTVAAQVLWKVVAGTKAIRQRLQDRRQLAIF